MLIYDLLSPDVRLKLTKLSKSNTHQEDIKPRKKRQKEQLTKRDIEELMQTDRTRYHRVRGRVKRK